MDNDLLCQFCGKTEAEHGPPGEGFRAEPNDRLCPVDGVSSQYFYSKATFHRQAAIRWAEDFRKMFVATALATKNAFPIGCKVFIAFEAGDITGIVYCYVSGFPDRISCLLAHGDVVDYPVEKVRRIH